MTGLYNQVYGKKCINKYLNTEDEFTGPINMGNPNEFPVLELAERIISMTGSSSKIVFKSLPDYDPKQRQPDITSSTIRTLYSEGLISIFIIFFFYASDIFKIFNHTLQPLFKFNSRLPTQFLFSQCNIRLALLRIIIR